MTAQTIQILFGLVSTVGIVVFAIAQWRNGSSRKNSDDIATANATIELLQKSLDVLEKNSKHDHEELIRLQEAIKHKDQQLETYLKILQGRNPETEAFMKFMTETAHLANQYMKETTKSLIELKKWTVDHQKLHDVI